MKALVSTLSALFLCIMSFAQVELSPLFTDNMVLQQKTEAPVWGKATPCAEITVFTSWNKREYNTTVSDDGTWFVKVCTPKAGGPYSMVVSENGKPSKTIDNILIGEVWLCSGQSNMEMPVKGWGRVMNFEQELKDAANYSQIRLLEVQQTISPLPCDTFSADNGGWMVCAPETLEEFSSTAYFFGREIHLKKGVPVGLINTSWGGTIIEAWMSKDALDGVKDLEDEAQFVSEWTTSKAESRIQCEEAARQWDSLLLDFDEQHMDHVNDFISNFQDESLWKPMRVPGYIEKVYPDFNGHILIKREVDIPASWEGKPLKIHMDAVDDKDYTYFNGALVGHFDGWNIEREYTVPAHLVKSGKNQVAVRILDMQNAGGVTGVDDTFYLESSDGQKIMLAGEWMSITTADYSALPSKPINIYDDPNWSTVLYNAMINPLVPYAIKGSIWYQGCSNTDRAYQYRDLMTLMIQDWRRAWGYDFPFYITQLSSWMAYQTEPEESAWAELREAQTIASRVTANTAMAVTIDIGDARDIHPKNKQEVGRRLALHALSTAYGEKVECSGPVYEDYQIDGNIIRLSFSSVGGGLVANGDELEGFTIAGADRKFYWAKAHIVGDYIEVSCENVERPLAVRYAWANNPVGNLFNAAGLPAGPFRTDDWPCTTLYKTSRF